MSEPAKELEPVPIPRNLPPAETSVVACIPKVVLTDPANDDEVVVALMAKMLEILATTPDEDAISKYASGVMSPSPKRPEDTDENLAKVEPPILLT